MSRLDRWILFGSWFSFAVWVALCWILVDENLQELQEAIGWWMIAVAIAPLALTGVGMAVLDEPGTDEPGTGEPASWADTEHRPLNGRGLEGCGGCGG
ncbi:hypothetical protein ACF1CG_33970 [Streptomyces sp. NPDC014773]|uniref:hypothetical protein n=1 Tax=Streptomyces sp. NPDC014773 TaxID=3364908 RepID=UPI0036FDE7CC